MNHELPKKKVKVPNPGSSRPKDEVSEIASDLSFGSSGGLDDVGIKERSLYQYQAFLSGAAGPRLRRSASFTSGGHYKGKPQTFADYAADWTDLTLRFGPAERGFREMGLMVESEALKAQEASVKLARDGPTRRRRAEEVRRRKRQISSDQPWRCSRYSGSPAGQRHLGRTCSADRGVFSTVPLLEASESEARLRELANHGHVCRRVRQLIPPTPKLNFDMLPPRPRTAN